MPVQASPDPEVRGPSNRVLALDGVRGIAIVLVVLGHGWILWPMDSIDEIPVVRGLFHGGTVIVFFVIGGFIVGGNLMREHAAGRLDPVRFYLRRIVRIGVQLVPLAIVILVVDRFDSTDADTAEGTRRSLVAVLTYTWNTWFIDNALLARADLGHLWYLSVQQQAYLVLPLLVVLLARSRVSFVVLMTVIAAAITVHRFIVLEQGDWVAASLLTTTRADGLFVGAAAVALLWPAGRGMSRGMSRLPRAAGAIALVTGLTLVGLVLVSPEVGPFAPLDWWGVAFTVVCAAFVVSVARLDGDRLLARGLAHPALTWLGKASLAIYVWHYPIFYAVSRHSPDWHWGARTAVAGAGLAVVVVLAQRLIEEPTRRWLATSSVFRAPKPPPDVEGDADHDAVHDVDPHADPDGDPDTPPEEPSTLDYGARRARADRPPA
jgi:peptidoglycan/LPS O-acetylase OafA/YrhL